VQPSGHAHDCSFGLFVIGSISSLKVFKTDATHTPPCHTSSNLGGAEGVGATVESAPPVGPPSFSEYVVCTVNKSTVMAMTMVVFLNHRGTVFMLLLSLFVTLRFSMTFFLRT
jgi:hypothetical protein